MVRMTNTACFWDALVMMVVCKPKGKNKALAQPWLSHPILGDYPPAKEPHRHRFRVLGPPHGAFAPPLTSSINILFVLILQRHFEPCDAFFSISYTTSVGSFITPQKRFISPSPSPAHIYPRSGPLAPVGWPACCEANARTSLVKRRKPLAASELNQTRLLQRDADSCLQPR